MRRISDEERRARLMRHVRTEGECWTWTRRSMTVGMSDGVPMNARRASWKLHCGEPSSAEWLDMLCGNERCINPAHMRLRGSPAGEQEHIKDHIKVTSRGCWEWQAALSSFGYAQYVALGERIGSRTSWVAHNGPIPPGLFVCHRCDNPPCVNPEHLFLGTAAENSLDATSKGRGLGKLMPSGVQRLRWLCASGMSQRRVAQLLGVSEATVSRTISGERHASAPTV